MPRMWSPRGRPGVDKSLEAGSQKQAPNCHTTEKHRCMVLCEATDNPQAGKWPGPLAWRVCFNWSFLVVTNNFATQKIKKHYNLQTFLISQKRTKMRVLHNHAFQNHIFFTRLENPMGIPWPVIMPGVCGFSLGLGCCTNVRQSCQA